MTILFAKNMIQNLIKLFCYNIIYFTKDNNNTKKLNKVIYDLTKLNYIMFEKKISLDYLANYSLLVWLMNHNYCDSLV
jgi:hypothetical protein